MAGFHERLTCSLLSGRPSGEYTGRAATCGSVSCPPGELLAIAIDSLVESIHFNAGTRAEVVAWKALAVNLSDLAAMGANPKTAAVSVSMPATERGWIDGFHRGLESAAREHAVDVVAATVVTGARVITVEVCGCIPRGLALTRAGARAGDAVYVTGTLGDAGLGLEILQGKSGVPEADAEFLISRLERPTPRIAAGRALRGVASAAIDISDGLAGDLGHILSASGVGARIDIGKLPRSLQFQRNAPDPHGLRLAASAGDDYELCFTVPAGRRDALEAVRQDLGVEITRIGAIETVPELRFVFDDGTTFQSGAAYDHFARRDPANVR